ncbi:MAG TPA: DUF3341 domain-containing protein [Bacteroidetes bacterium]|nr:DUF3341 domain-containing protein [Bacteroidota bacterium]
MSRKFLVGIYNDDEKAVSAVRELKKNHMDVYDVISPFAVHGMDDALGLAESRLHITGFIYGATGTAIAYSLMTWVFTSDWPLNFGGKPHYSFPAFIPIMFEFTVLCASIGMTVTFLLRSGLFPGRIRETLDDRFTDDKFGVVFHLHKNLSQQEIDKIKQMLQSTGAEEIKEKELAKHY